MFRRLCRKEGVILSFVALLSLSGVACGGGSEETIEVEPTVTQQQGSQMDELMQKQVQMLQQGRSNQGNSQNGAAPPSQ